MVMNIGAEHCIEAEQKRVNEIAYIGILIYSHEMALNFVCI